jgi:Holliday junction DNA helicase RuvA
MYAYIHGRLDTKKSDGVIVEAGGVGYQIFTPPSVISRLPAANSDVKLYTHFIVREDAHLLFGFLSKDELGMFETLLTVSGVGPKAALSLVSALQPSQFGLAVLTEDYKLLTRAQGVGAKLAQKIIFELRDKMRKEISASGDGRGIPVYSMGAAGAELTDHGKFGEAVEALIVLGYSGVEANGAVSAVFKDESSLEAIIRAALSML